MRAASALGRARLAGPRRDSVGRGCSCEVALLAAELSLSEARIYFNDAAAGSLMRSRGPLGPTTARRLGGRPVFRRCSGVTRYAPPPAHVVRRARALTCSLERAAAGRAGLGHLRRGAIRTASPRRDRRPKGWTSRGRTVAVTSTEMVRSYRRMSRITPMPAAFKGLAVAREMCAPVVHRETATHVRHHPAACSGMVALCLPPW